MRKKNGSVVKALFLGEIWVQILAPPQPPWVSHLMINLSVPQFTSCKKGKLVFSTLCFVHLDCKQFGEMTVFN